MKFCPKCEVKLKKGELGLECPKCDYVDGEKITQKKKIVKPIPVNTDRSCIISAILVVIVYADCNCGKLEESSSKDSR